jgi:hypothetical protein
MTGPGANPNAMTIKLGNGQEVDVPTVEKPDRDGGRDVKVKVPDFEGFAPCKRCRGDVTRDGDVSGGWLPHFRFEGGSWYTSARPCPDCVWGGYRKLAAKKIPFHTQFPGCSATDLGMLGMHLRTGVTTFRDAVAEVRTYRDLHGRLTAGLDAMERRGQLAEVEHAF